MTNTVLESQRFNIDMTASRDFKGIERYIVRYGLQTTLKDDMLEATEEFNNCLKHALRCEGYFDEEE